MSMLNKICVCFWCSEVACAFASCYDMWAANEACGLSCINCYGCCWTVCAPICHTCTVGDFGKGMTHCVKALKYCLFSCAVSACSPVDGCYNCIFYTKKNFESGVTGSKDILENTRFMAKIIENALDIKGSNEPDQTFKTFTP